MKVNNNPFKMLGSYIGVLIFIIMITVGIMIFYGTSLTGIPGYLTLALYYQPVSTSIWLFSLLLTGFLLGWLGQLIYQKVKQ